ncbi:MAG: Uma2 family endonuclease, partial [Lachnospiraceae bacterium]|nr:Uma2 family endonuclease [Lachnospiraceae bacterium]
MASVQQKNYTIDDIYALPEGQRAELIDGRLYMMAPPIRI